MSKLSSYVVDRDYGFAPNPFWGYCTLATCKPNIRGHAEIGDYVIGFGGRRTGQFGKLIFLMKVEEKMTFEKYWEDPRFQIKKPNIYGSLKMQYGDNIYHKDMDGGWIQDNSHHSEEDNSVDVGNRDADTKHDSVLISEHEWWYFGDHAIQLPPDYGKFAYQRRGCKNFSEDTGFLELVAFVNSIHPEKGRIGLPDKWRLIMKKGNRDHE